MAESFRVTMTPATPVSINHPWLHFDGLINHLRYMRLLGRDYYNLPSKQVWTPPTSMHDDFEHVLCYRQEIPFASVSTFEPDCQRSIQYYKRFEEDGAPGKSVNIGSGRYRNWMLRTVYQPAHTVTFYGRGHIDLVRDLLSSLTHLGNDTRIGWGQLRGIDVQEIERDDDRSIVFGGVAQRPIPVRYLSDYSDAVRLAWRSPYWAAQNVELCAPPGTEVVWK